MTYESFEAREARIDVGAVIGAVVRRLPRILLVTLALLALAFVALLFVPRGYESSASILVESRANVYSRATNEQAASSSGSETGVVSSQIELLKSRDTLLTVIDQLDLRSVPEFNGAGGGLSPLSLVSALLGRQATQVSIDETVLNNLYERLTVSQERDSRLMSVTVSSTDPDLASRIANAIANAHVARRAQLSLSDTAEASSWLADEIAKLRVSVTAAETAVADFRVNNNLFLGTGSTSLTDQQLSTVAGQINAAQERKSTALSRAALIRGMIEQGQPIDGVADVRDSVVIQQLSEEKARLQGEKAQRSATLLANHPTILALTAQIAELNNQITIEGRRVVDALEAEARIESDLEASLQAELSRAKSVASTATQDTVTLDSLEREAKAQRDLLEGYLQRYSEAVSRTEANSALPDVRVVSVAAPAVSPASPKTSLILISVGIVSVLVQLGVIVFGELISGRAIMAAPEAPEDEEEALVDADDDVAPAVVPLAVAEPVPAAVPVAATAAPLVVAPAQPEPPQARPESSRAERIAALAELRKPAPAPVAPLRAPAASLPSVMAIADLSSDLVLGRTHLLILAAHRNNEDCAALAEELVADALSRGLSVALLDAGSARPSVEFGLADLSIDAASFGDVVQKSADNSFAEVPWGQGRIIDRASTKPLTLVEALGDIYEVVVLMTGRVGGASTLPMFYGLDGRLVLVAGDDDDLPSVAQTRERLLAAGYDRCELVAAPTRVAA